MHRNYWTVCVALALAGCGGGGGSGGAGTGSGGGDLQAPSPFRILAANDLGMHCMDREFSVFSILPPFNVFNAQVVKQLSGSSKPLVLDGSQIDVRYSAITDPSDVPHCR